MTRASTPATATPIFLEEGAALRCLGHPEGATSTDARDGRAPSVRPVERYDVVVVGAGQSGLSVGYHLARRGLRFVILDAHERVGDVWRKRWDSLRLFTPARYDGLVGMPFPASNGSFPTKDEMADYLESYAERFALPIRTGTRVRRLSRRGEVFVLESDDVVFEADQVVVAMASYQRPKVPAFASELDPGIVQLHSQDYRSPSQLARGAVLVVGAGNSGAEIAQEVSQHHATIVSGRDTGEVPFRIDGFWGRYVLVRLVLRFVFHRILTVRTPIGRRARPKLLHVGGPLIRTKWRDLFAAGVERAPRMAGTRGGRPLLEDGRVLDVANVLWCTGFHPGFQWIDLPVFGADGEPRHVEGAALDVPGLHFVGLHFLYAFSSTMVHGAARDAARTVDAIVAKRRERSKAVAA